MKILAIDTSSSWLKIGLLNESRCIASLTKPPVTHSEAIIPAIEGVLSGAKLSAHDIQLVAAARGPGSFTGLRIGIATAKGLALSLGIPVALVPTLDIYGEAWKHESGMIVPILDARKHRIYCARYLKGSRIGKWMDIEVSMLIEMLNAEEEVHFVGPDADLVESICFERPGWQANPSHLEIEIEALAHLGLQIFQQNGAAKESDGPLYLREPEIGEPILR